jgi:nucleoside-diphosphate-sugar epimerase
MQRDLLDIRDALEAYSSLLRARYDSGSVFNICSGRAIRSSEFAAALLEQLGDTREVSFSGVSELPMLGNCDRLRSAAEWHPRFELMDVARFFVEALGAAF